MKSIKERWSRPHKRNGRFYHNSSDVPSQRNIDALLQLIYSLAREFSIVCFAFVRRLKTVAATRRLHELYRPKRKKISPGLMPEKNDSPLRITWIGHASFLIECGKATILTDPIFGQPSILFPRITPPGIALQALPPIDYILISHNHWDHMHAGSLKALRSRFPEVTVLVPVGTGSWFLQRGFKQVVEHTWWQSTMDFSHDIRFTFTPARHWSQRTLFDRNRSLWGSWMIEHESATIYFGGDTAYDTHFEAIAQVFPRIDIALMPIGPCEPRRWMCHSHISAEEAGEGFKTLNAQHFIPMHWGTFYFGMDYLMTPIERLTVWWSEQESHLHDKQLHVLGIGQSFEK